MAEITESRKKALARRFGSNCCLTPSSWVLAIDQDMTDVFRVYPEDMQWMRLESTSCVSGCDTSEGGAQPTGINISTGGVQADVYSGSVKIGTANTFIPVVAGTHTFTIRADGYLDKSVTLNVTDGYITNYTVTLVAKSSEGEVPPDSGRIVEGTGGVPLSVDIIKDADGNPVTVKPTNIEPGVEQWYGIKVKNPLSTTWYGFLGVKWTDSSGVSYVVAPDINYSQAVPPGEEKTIWRKTSLESGALGSGTINVSLLLRGYRS